MAARVLHVSDLHVGKRDVAVPIDALRELTREVEPDLVLATGDLANRGRHDQLERAEALLHSLEAPLLAVPGNHDIPYSAPARFTATLAEWERVFGTAEPVFRTEGLVAVGLCSARPWRQQGGALSPASLAHAATALRDPPPGALRIVALHHHLAAPPWRAARKKPLSDRDTVLEALVEAGAELVVGGHVHQASVAEIREFHVAEPGRSGSIVLATAPGLGRPRPRRSGEAQGVNLYESDDATLTVTTLVWDGGAFAETGRRAFPRR